ncbi:MAG: phage tail assembly protein [Bradyrhizobium sp.]|nr:phage tail assembly protein [Bradyrhizobium sp.]
MAIGTDDAAAVSGDAPLIAVRAQKPLHWSAGYVGIPFAELGRARDGADCWGLACLVYAEQLGITLPTYDGLYSSIAERAEIAALINGAVSVPGIWTDAREAPDEFDVAVFRRGRLGSHVGLLIAPGRMLHMPEDGSARIEDYTVPRWASKLAGVYRHAEVKR